MNDEHDLGDPNQNRPHGGEGFLPHHSSTCAVSPSATAFSPHLTHPSQPQLVGLGPPPFIPYSPFLSDASVSALPTPPQVASASAATSPTNGYPNFGVSPQSAYPIHSLPHQHGELSPLMTNMFGAALTSPGLATASSYGIDPVPPVESLGATGGGGGIANGNKIVQKADRSCKKCRERRVRCDRQYPACARCTKRREHCSYGTGVFVETVEEGSDAAKIAELESKVASLETQLKSATSNHSSNTAKSIPTRPTPPPPAPLSSLARESLAAVVANAVTSGLTLEERDVLDQLLNDQDQIALHGRVGGGGNGGSRNDIAITCFLLDASTRACCTKLPGLHLLRDRLPYFKANLNSLDPPHLLAVVCMCAIGTRVYPTSNLFGIQSVTQQDGTPIPHLFRTVGQRRERICDALCKVAMEACWELGILRDRSYENLDALVGFVQYLIHEEGKPEEARFFVRELVGMYLDLRHEELSAGTPTKLNESNTTAVFLADGAVSSTCHKPSFITPVDLQDYFASGGLRVPDLVNMQLGELIEEQLGAPLNRPGILSMLTSLCLYVFSCHRVFSQVSNPRRPSGSSILPFLRNLWSVLDQIHQAVQRLQQHLVNLSTAPAGYVDDPQAIDHAILLAVRADNSLVDLIMLIHVHLKEKYSASTFWPEKDGDEELERMRSESSMRVFKCLKLLAFYCQLYLASQDKHNVFHLVLRLELLPNWTSMVAARIGTPEGPISEEFEVTHEELDWFRCALELACYYSPRASSRLAALQAARQNSSPYSAPSPSTNGSEASRTTYDHLSNSSTLSTIAEARSPLQPLRRTSQSHQQYDTPPSTASTHYTQNPLSSSSTFAQNVPSQHEQHERHQSFSSHTSSTSTGLVIAEDFAMNEQVPLPAAVAIAGFADGTLAEGGSTSAVKNAFRSLDWIDLSLTPALGSGSDGSSTEGAGDRSK